MRLQQIDFTTILPIWQNLLWPNRTSAIEPVSCIQLFGEKDYSIMSAAPTFFGVFKDDRLIGVNSGFKTSSELYRSRGIYVLPEFRKAGVAHMLFAATCEQARKEQCDSVWSMPRLSAVRAYQNFGFTIVSQIENRYNEQNEDHVYVILTQQ